jgi:hypothetical protein
MGELLKLIVVSQFEQDANLLVRALSEAGFAPSATRIETREELLHAVTESQVDAAFLCDGLPRLDALEAIRLIGNTDLIFPSSSSPAPFGRKRRRAQSTGGSRKPSRRSPTNGEVSFWRACPGKTLCVLLFPRSCPPPDAPQSSLRAC